MTEKLTRLVADCSTGEVTEVELTDAEQTEFLNMQAEMKAQQDAFVAAETAKAAARASAETKLAALGLTADEVAALLN